MNIQLLNQITDALKKLREKGKWFNYPYLRLFSDWSGSFCIDDIKSGSERVKVEMLYSWNNLAELLEVLEEIENENQIR